MKKIYVMASFLGAGLFAFGQDGGTQGAALKKLNVDPIKSVSSNGYQKAAGDILWHENFDSIVYVANNSSDSLSIPSAGFWTIDNDSETDPGYGWIIGDTDEGWHPNNFATNFASSSGGNHAQVNNGDPLTDSQKLNKLYYLTSGIINVDSLSGGSPVLITFEQTGARFYDSQFLEISLNGTTWTKIYDNADVKAMHAVGSSNPYGTQDFVEVDLAQHIPSGQGEAVQLRFGWTTNEPAAATNPNVWVTYGWIIDDIKILVKGEYDLKFLSASHHFTNAEYSQIPTEQVSEMEVKAAVYNIGSEDLTGITLRLLEGGTEVATGTLAFLASSATDTVVLTYTPDNSLGVKTYTLEVEPAEVDENLGNNQSSYEIKIDVNENIYAADRLDFGEDESEYTFGIELQDDGYELFKTVGIYYDIYENRELFAIDIAPYAGEGNEISVGIELITETEKILVSESDPYEIQASDVGSVISIELFETPTLLAGNTYRVFVNAFGSDEVSLVASGNTAESGQVTYERMDNTLIRITNMYAIPVIRMNFDETVSIKENELNELGLTQYPNPFSNETTVQFTLKDASEVSYTVVDVTGKVVATANEGQLMAGVNEITIDGSSFANGVYYLNLTAGNSNVTHKMVVNK